MCFNYGGTCDCWRPGWRNKSLSCMGPRIDVFLVAAGAEAPLVQAEEMQAQRVRAWGESSVVFCHIGSFGTA